MWIFEYMLYIIPFFHKSFLAVIRKDPTDNVSIVVVGFECYRDPENYAGGSVATGRVTYTGQIKG
jgi:hypothetical protein